MKTVHQRYYTSNVYQEIKRLAFILSKTFASTVDTIDDDISTYSQEWDDADARIDTPLHPQASYAMDVIKQQHGGLQQFMADLASSTANMSNKTPNSLLSSLKDRAEFNFVIRFANAIDPFFGCLEDKEKLLVYQAASVHFGMYKTITGSGKGMTESVSLYIQVIPLSISFRFERMAR